MESRPRRTNIFWKLTLVSVCGLVLLVAMARITYLVEERKGRQWEADQEIRMTWGGEQSLAAPMLRIPHVLQQVSGGGGTLHRRVRLHLLPERLDIVAELEPQVRSRGLFDTVVYTARLRIEGEFHIAELGRQQIDPATLQWSDAELLLGVGNLRGLAGSPRVRWQGSELPLEAVDGEPALAQWLGARLPAPLEAGAEIPFEIVLDLKGSRSLRLLPLGRETKIDLGSTWPNPSFQGGFLPASSTVNDDGFRASWSIPHFARGFPQVLHGSFTQDHLHAMEQASTGVDLLLAVDFYQLVSRCTKYSILFIGLTFGLYMLFEVLSRLRIHPVQYLMVGFALCLFFLLLLALAEHIGFDRAYLLAAGATVALITSYSAVVLHTRRRGAMLGSALGLLYGVLYVLVQLQTYSLLVGSFGLFAVLAGAMYLTRGIDWYSLESPQSPDPGDGSQHATI